MTTEPKYDEDVVNLGYLKKIVADPEGNLENIYENVSKHYASKPQPPYHKGDTWIDGNIIYTCINDREIGTYQDSDWTTESGAREEAEKKNKVFLRQPSNYSVGDMWILQSDDDHKAGKKGEILISTAGRKEYNENDWVNMLGYGTIASINEVANNLNDAIERIGVTEEAIADGLIVTFYQDTIPEGKHIGDLWYVTETVDEYIKGKLYRYNGEKWEILKDPEITQAFEEANEARIVADGKIQSFYTATAPLENVGVGDLWIDTDDNNKLYRYNGTNWVAVYDTRIDTIQKEVETVTETTVEIQTDLGQINNRVNTVETTITTLGQIEKAEGKEITVDASNNPAKLYVYGNTEQETRSGKNLLNYGSSVSGTKNGVSYSYDETTGIWTLNGTATAQTDIFVITKTDSYPILKANTAYVLTNYFISGSLTGSGGRLYLQDRNNNYKGIACAIGKSNTSESRDSSYTDINLTMNDNVLRLFNGSTFTNYKFRTQLEIGTVKTDWEPYGAMPSPDYPSDIRNVGDNINLFDYEYFYNNYVEKANSDAGRVLLQLKPLTNYTISTNLPYGANSSSARLFAFSGNDTQAALSSDTQGVFIDKPRTVASDINGNIVIALYTKGTYAISKENFENGTYWVKLEQGTKATSPSEYSCGSVEFKVENKNKFNIDVWKNFTLSNDSGKKTVTENSITLENPNGVDLYTLTGMYTTNGTVAEQYRKYLMEVKPNTTYIVSFDAEGTEVSGTINSSYYCLIDKNYKSTFYKAINKFSVPSTKNTTVITTSNNTKYIGIRLGVEAVKGRITSYSNIQLEEGEIQTNYIEHQEQTVVFPLSQGQLLHKGDYLAEDGIHQVRNTHIFTGEESIHDIIALNNVVRFRWYLEIQGIENSNQCCSHLQYIHSFYDDTEHFYIGLTSCWLFLPLGVGTTATEIKSYLTEQYTNGTPLTVEYERAEETITPYTPEQQKVLDSIETFKGINHIYCIDEIEPERMILTYYPNTPYNDTLVNKDTFEKVTTDMNAEFNIRANEVETSVKEQTTATILTLLNNNYLSAEQVNALVEGNAEDIATVKEQLTQTVTSSQMQIEITKAIEGGVSYLKNTLFTIDENGMTIATDYDEFSAKYDNKGMRLYSYGELIAYFDVKGTTIQGNLNLNGEFITPNLRMMNVEVDGVPHTHIHWIGG